jgi:hypothetical protein
MNSMRRVATVLSSSINKLFCTKEDPLNIISINSYGVKYCTRHIDGITISRNYGPRSVHIDKYDRGYFPAGLAGVSIGGNWDLPEIHVEDMQEYVALSEFLSGSKSWFDTAFSKKIEQLISSGLNAYGFTSIDAYRKSREHQILELASSIRCNGVRATSTNPFRKSYYDNIQVNIGRDGSYIFNGGFHRFCIARLLGIESIPVLVVARHIEFCERYSV